MPIEATIIDEHNLVYSHCSGSLTLEDILLAQDDDLAAPGYQSGRLDLIDLRDVADPHVDLSGLDTFLHAVHSRYAQKFPGDGCNARAVVLAASDLTFGLARQFQSLAQSRSGVDITVYRDEPSLMADIGKPGQTLADLLGRTAESTAGTACIDPSDSSVRD